MSEDELEESRADKLFLVKLCEQAERYEDMISEVKDLITHILNSDQPIPTEEERNLLIISYKNLLYTYGRPYRYITTRVHQLDNRGESRKAEMAENYTIMLQEKAVELCYEVNEILDEILMVDSLPIDDLVLYWKSKGDFYEYISNVDYRCILSEWKGLALESYEKSRELSRSLSCVNINRLKITLACSVFHAHLMQDIEKAVEIAQPEYEEIMKHVKELMEKADEDENYEAKDILNMIQLIRDNLMLWNSEIEIGPDD